MAIRISGPGIGLPVPQNLYPTELYNAPYDVSTNKVTLNAGDAIAIPAGEWLITLGAVSVLQYLDPVTGVWAGLAADRGQPQYIRADGFTTRIANLTGCPVAAVVTGGGSGYVQATTSVTASAGGSTWAPIVGGQVSVVSVGAAGSGYTMAPIVLLPAPPQGGIPATAYATISAGTVSGVTLSNVGAGYPSAPAAVILPNPADPNYGAIVQASATLGLNAATATAITGVLCTGNGAPVSSAPTLTASGAGSGATISAVLLQTVTGASIAGAGVGYGTSAELTTVGGRPAAGAYVNPNTELTGYRPRAAQIGLTLTGTSLTAIGPIYDGGLFADGTAPTAIIISNGAPSTAATVSLTLGSTQDTVTLQQL